MIHIDRLRSIKDKLKYKILKFVIWLLYKDASIIKDFIIDQEIGEVVVKKHLVAFGDFYCKSDVFDFAHKNTFKAKKALFMGNHEGEEPKISATT